MDSESLTDQINTVLEDLDSPDQTQVDAVAVGLRILETAENDDL